jgi:hypothetical protein
MPFSLFECRDGTFVVVPAGLAPPAAAYRAHGEFVLVSNACRHLYDTVVWDDISKVIDRQLYATVPPEVAFCLFEVGAPALPDTGSDRAATRRRSREPLAPDRKRESRNEPVAGRGARPPRHRLTKV